MMAAREWCGMCLAGPEQVLGAEETGGQAWCAGGAWKSSSSPKGHGAGQTRPIKRLPISEASCTVLYCPSLCKGGRCLPTCLSACLNPSPAPSGIRGLGRCRIES